MQTSFYMSSHLQSSGFPADRFFNCEMTDELVEMIGKNIFLYRLFAVTNTEKAQMDPVFNIY